MEELRESEDRFRALADDSPVMIWVTDPQGHIQYVNRAYCEFFATSLEAVQHEGWQPLVHPEDAAAYVEAFYTALHRRQPFHCQARVRRADGQWRWVESRGRPRYSTSGEFLGIAGSSPDVTESKHAEEALREADRRKDEFLAVLSHELRNPLAPIRNSVYVLERAAPGSEPARRALAVISRQVVHLTRLVDDLLDVARVARGKVQLHRDQVELGELVRRTVEDHRPVLAARQVELVSSIVDRPLWIHADGTRIAQVIGNLLQNAAKFTRAGGRVDVELTAEGADNGARGTAVLRVRDSGIGLAPDMLAGIFEPFTQADDSLARSHGGLGLGLALVKGLVDLHGGRVEAASEGLGRGSTFTVHLPLDEAQLIEEETAQARPRVGRRVLVIEDNIDAADSLDEALQLDGHEVAVAYSGPDGLARARAFHPDVVLCDIGLPEMDGYEVARAFRSDPRLSGAYLVALTGYARPDDLRRASEAGFDRHIAKPPSLDKLHELLTQTARR